MIVTMTTEETKPQYIQFSINLKKKYREWKKAEHGTQEKLAELVGVQDRKSISDWMNGKSFPNNKNLYGLCSVLNTSPVELCGLSDIKKKCIERTLRGTVDTAKIEKATDALAKTIVEIIDIEKKAFLMSAQPDGEIYDSVVDALYEAETNCKHAAIALRDAKAKIEEIQKKL